MSSQIEHAFAAALAFEKVFLTVQNNDLLDVLPRVLRKAREFHGHPAKIAEHSADYGFSLRIAPVWKGNTQVDFRRPSQPRQKKVQKSRESGGQATRRGPGQNVHTRKYKHDQRRLHWMERVFLRHALHLLLQPPWRARVYRP